MSIQNEIDRIITAVQAAHEKVAEKGGTTAQPYLVANLASAIDSIPDASDPVLQEKTVTPKTSAQSVTPDSGYDGLSKVTVNAMPTATQATPSISVSSSGLITASATQTEGYVAAGTKSATKQLTTQAATTYTPGTSNQTISEGTYCSGAQTIKGDANLVAGNIKSGVSIFGVAGSYEGSGGSGGSSDVELVYVTFMSHDGLKELHKRAVVSGNDCMEIVAGGLIDAPTRESTASQVFTFAGWSTVANGGLDENALKSVTADRTVYANYIEGVRHYTVSFYDGDTLLTTQSVAYGSAPVEYTPEKEGYKFDGWTPAFSAVKSDVSYYAKWIDMSSLLGFGDCGENATWTLTQEGVLTISGTGELRHSGLGPTAGWYPQRDYVTSLVVEEGITGLGFQSVINLTNVVSVSLPSSLISIGGDAFRALGATSIVIPAGVTTIGELAFNGAAITSATFVETSGWKAGDTALAASNLANKATAATYLKKTYIGKKWTRS